MATTTQSLTATSTPALVREYAGLRVAEAIGALNIRELKRQDVVVAELIRRDVLNGVGSTGPTYEQAESTTAETKHPGTVTPERLAEWGARIDGYAQFAAASPADRQRLVFRSIVLAWLTGMAAHSSAETIAAATSFVRDRMGAYDANRRAVTGQEVAA